MEVFIWLLILLFVLDNFKPSRLNPEQEVSHDIDDAKLDVLLKSAVKSARKQNKIQNSARSMRSNKNAFVKPPKTFA